MTDHKTKRIILVSGQCICSDTVENPFCICAAFWHTRSFFGEWIRFHPDTDTDQETKALFLCLNNNQFRKFINLNVHGKIRVDEYQMEYIFISAATVKQISCWDCMIFCVKIFSRFAECAVSLYQSLFAKDRNVRKTSFDCTVPKQETLWSETETEKRLNLRLVTVHWIQAFYVWKDSFHFASRC